MKATLSPTATVFTPLKLELIIENEEELKDLYHRFNLASTVVKEESDKCATWNPQKSLKVSDTIWNLLDEVMEDLCIEP